MVTSSARELASIFSITRARCSLTVRIVIPNSLAISLLSRPETTWFRTSCSRGVCFQAVENLVQVHETRIRLRSVTKHKNAFCMLSGGARFLQPWSAAFDLLGIEGVRIKLVADTYASLFLFSILKTSSSGSECTSRTLFGVQIAVYSRDAAS
jgi:hypothetical protein